MKTDAHWEKIGKRPHHGICLPLFSLRTKKSCGIGEFLDLIPLIDWCKKIGFDCIQLLPIYDTGRDPSPYNPLSSIALDPVYLSLPGADPALFHNNEPHVNKKAILDLKIEWLRRHFSPTPAYQIFLETHSWVHPYARFKAMKEKFDGKHWRDWPHEDPDPSSVAFYAYLQFLCYSQMEQVYAYASKQNVKLMGDIPILLSPDSVDVWTHPELFHTELAAGAPPDYYNPLGQKWGFPLFNWEEMKKTGYEWWKKRLKAAEKIYHMYRIDHVVGFFRIWAIPQDNLPSEGFFVPEDRNLWASQGKEHLEMMLSSTTMLPIAEDLGTIPQEVYPILKELGICGTHVMRWEKKSDGSFIPFDQYEPYSLTTVSTADMPPLELWWKQYPDEAVPFASFMHWSYHPILIREQRLQILKAAHHTSSYFHINLLEEYLALFPEFIWANPEEERINFPGTLLPTNWTYRFRPYLEEIAQRSDLQTILKAIVEN